ncbi:ABC transporter permease, partial [Ilumatobacter sp.]|uniref:ABC transporter permease n=1 Tax=Ilumatobacter sp. TaxID=1967498 RepID=UPI003C53AD14
MTNPSRPVDPLSAPSAEPVGRTETPGAPAEPEGEVEIEVVDGEEVAAIPLPPESFWSKTNRIVDPVTQLARVAVIVLVLLLWKYAVDAEWIDPLFAAGPGDTARAFWELLHEKLFWEDLVVTLREAILGWGIGAFFGILVGLILGRWIRASKALGPFLTFSNALPKVALA